MQLPNGWLGVFDGGRDDIPRSFSSSAVSPAGNAKIEAGNWGYAQGIVRNHTVSMHPIYEGVNVLTITTSSTFLSFREARDALIDGTALESAIASRGTFTREDYYSRADYYERGYLLTDATPEDKAFAARLRAYGDQL